MANIIIPQNDSNDEQQPFTVFTFANGQTVRAIILDGKPWFVRQDVFELLDLKSRTSARSLPPDEKGVHTVHTLGGPQEMLW